MPFLIFTATYFLNGDHNYLFLFKKIFPKILDRFKATKIDLLHQTCSYAHSHQMPYKDNFFWQTSAHCFFYCTNEWMYFPLTRCVLPNWVVASPERDTNLGIVTYRLHPVVSKILTFPRTHNPRVLIWRLVFQNIFNIIGVVWSACLTTWRLILDKRRGFTTFVFQGRHWRHQLMKNNVLRAAPDIFWLDSMQASLLLKITNNATKYKNNRNSSRRGGQVKWSTATRILFLLISQILNPFLFWPYQMKKISGLGIQNTLINAIEGMWKGNIHCCLFSVN